MCISNFRIQHILRSYSRQLTNRAWVPERYINEEEVTLSAESKKGYYWIAPSKRSWGNLQVKAD
jgi:hypothetical protein